MASTTTAGSDDGVVARLRTGSLNVVDGTVIGVSSAAPAYSLTSAMAVLSAGVGLWSPSAMIVAFFPMLGVAVGFYWLNRRIPDCGTSYAWISRALHPGLGFLTGWVIIAADVVVMISEAGVAASSTLTLFGLDSTNVIGVLLVGLAWIAVMTWIVFRGIQLAAKVQWVMLGLEYAIVIGFCAWAIVNVYVNHPAGSHPFASTWLLPWAAPAGGTGLLAALLGAVFLYWGWDSAVNVNEETKDATVTPGWACIYGTFALLVIYAFAAIAVVMYLPDNAIQKNPSGVLTYMAQSLAGGSRWWYLMVLAVVSSAAAVTQTTILPTARVAFSMARDRVIPSAFAKVHRNYLTPWFATLVMGTVSAVVYAISVLVSGVGSAITDAVAATGLQVAFYYGLTGVAAAWYYRKLLFRSVPNFVFAGVFPAAGGLGFFYIFYAAARGLTPRQLLLGLGAMAIGLPLLAWSWSRNPTYYRRPREAATP